MTAKQKYDWTEEPLHMAQGQFGLTLWVRDDYCGHAATLNNEDDVQEALADYAAGYDAGGDPCRCKVRWDLFLDGDEIDRGTYSWDYPIPQGGNPC